jgi:RNA polymerase sigma-32 factor
MAAKEGSRSDGRGLVKAALEPTVVLDEGDAPVPSLEGEPLPPDDALDVVGADVDGVLERDPDDEVEGEVLDVGSEALVRRRGVILADEAGEWVKEQDISPDAAEVVAEGDLYRTFVREATRYQRLADDEERVLGRKVRDHADKGAAKKLVVHNLRLAIKMAHQYRRSWTNVMDLVQEASAGLAIAAERWDPDQGTRFGTYAVYWIRAQLTKFLMTNGRLIHTANTRSGRKLYFQLPRIKRKLIAEGKETSVANIAREVGEDEIEVARVLTRLEGREASLDAPLGDDGDGSTLADIIEGGAQTPEIEVNDNEMRVLMTRLVTRFGEKLEDERDRAIWHEHLVSPEPVSLVDLGKRFEVSKQRMGQLATRLKRSFRRFVIEELGPETKLSWLFSTD